MEAKQPLILAKAHEGITGGHYVGKASTQKVKPQVKAGGHIIKGLRKEVSHC
jgi:hypothetical protein